MRDTSIVIFELLCMQRIPLIIEQISDMGVVIEEISYHLDKMNPEDEIFIRMIHVISSGMMSSDANFMIFPILGTQHCNILEIGAWEFGVIDGEYIITMDDKSLPLVNAQVNMKDIS
jgi:hypothetical protein